MAILERRGVDRRVEPRGGRRTSDRPGRAPRVLVADNYDGTRRPAAEYLSRYGFDVVEATTAAQTIAVLAERPPRVLLTGLEDDEADRLYRQVAQAPTLPVILLNADARTPPPFAPAAILAKPFHLPAMLRTLRDVLALQAIG